MFKHFFDLLLYSLSIIGAIVGVGFVSGKEIVSFFFCAGKYGVIIIGLSCLVLFCCLYITMKNIYIKNIHKNKMCNIEINNVKINTKTSYLSVIMNKIVGILCLIISATMIGGIDVLLLTLGWNNQILRKVFVLILLFFEYYILTKKSQNILKTSEICTIFLIVIMIICVFCNFDNGVVEYENSLGFSGIFMHGLFSVVSYVSMNMLSVRSIIKDISNKCVSKKQIVVISALASVLLFVLMMLVFFVLSVNSSVAYSSMPLLMLAQNVSRLFFFVYIIILFIGCFVSLLAVSYSGISELCGDNNYSIFNVGIYFIVASILSLIGFDFLVGYGYKIIGIVYLVLLVLLKKCKK